MECSRPTCREALIYVGRRRVTRGPEKTLFLQARWGLAGEVFWLCPKHWKKHLDGDMVALATVGGTILEE